MRLQLGVQTDRITRKIRLQRMLNPQNGIYRKGLNYVSVKVRSMTLSILQMAISVPWRVPLGFGSTTLIREKNSFFSQGTQGVFYLSPIPLMV